MAPPKVISCNKRSVAILDPVMVEQYGGSGARGADECVELCVAARVANALQSVTRASTCAEAGYTVWQEETAVRVDGTEMTTNVFVPVKKNCPRLTGPFSPSVCPNPIRLGWYGNAFGTCVKAVGCGNDRKTYLRKLFRTKAYCDRAMANLC
jgi:hypothetical protein